MDMEVMEGLIFLLLNGFHCLCFVKFKATPTPPPKKKEKKTEEK